MTKNFGMNLLLLSLLLLIGSIIVRQIFNNGLHVLETLSDNGKCSDCDKKNVNTSLSAMGSQLGAIKSDIDAIKGRVGANEAKLSTIDLQMGKNTSAITEAHQQMQQLETEINNNK